MSNILQGIQVGYAEVKLSSQTLSSCIQACLNDANCKTLAFRASTGSCRIHYKFNTAYSYQSWSYYVKECTG